MTKQEYAEYLKSPHWQSMRLWALERAERHCQLCAGTGTLDVHHNNYSRVGQERPADVVVLCRRCHTRFHEPLHTLLETDANPVAYCPQCRSDAPNLSAIACDRCDYMGRMWLRGGNLEGAR